MKIIRKIWAALLIATALTAACPIGFASVAIAQGAKNPGGRRFHPSIPAGAVGERRCRNIAGVQTSAPR